MAYYLSTMGRQSTKQEKVGSNTFITKITLRQAAHSTYDDERERERERGGGEERGCYIPSKLKAPSVNTVIKKGPSCPSGYVVAVTVYSPDCSAFNSSTVKPRLQHVQLKYRLH